MSTALAQSYEHCREVVQASGSNFAWAFWLLPREQRQAMYALYAFARITDDLSDGEQAGDAASSNAARQRALTLWRHGVQASLACRPIAADTPGAACLPAIADMVQRFSVPQVLLHDLIEGVTSDLAGEPMRNWPELQRYCYLVAGTVGIACIHIWGYRDARALALAEVCGQAFQLTNILRDIREDAERGRLYLPLDELQLQGFDRQSWPPPQPSEAFDAAMTFQIARAKQLYEQASEIERYLTPRGIRVFRLMFARYRAILQKIESAPRVVLQRRVSLSMRQKLGVALQQLCRRTS